jgi:hypothetical protein
MKSLIQAIQTEPAANLTLNLFKGACNSLTQWLLRPISLRTPYFDISLADIAFYRFLSGEDEGGVSRFCLGTEILTTARLLGKNRVVFERAYVMPMSVPVFVMGI